MSFTEKKIDLTFKLGQGAFGLAGENVVKVSGLRVQAEIINAGGPSLGEAHVRVYGLTASMMNQLAKVTRSASGRIEIHLNQILIEAGDDVSGMAQIFQGQIILSTIDMSGAPDSALMVVAQAGAFEAVKPTTPLSYPGSASVAEIMKTIADQNNYRFENGGVTVVLSTPYLPGTPLEQIRRCAEAADINWAIDNGTLAIWPMGGSRPVGTVPLVSPETGMIGYPSNYDIGVAVRTLFNPKLQIGSVCQVESSLPFANGRFVMFDISHEIESEVPGGAWFSTFHGSPFNA